jgi:hypothetical protein
MGWPKLRIFAVAAVLALFSAPLTIAGDGVFSRDAASVWSLARKKQALSSPDGVNKILVEASPDQQAAWPLIVRVSRKGKTYPINLERVASAGAEVAWAQDSSAFFVTYSDGGAVGTYHVLIYRVDDNGLHSYEPIENGRKLFPPYCFDPERPNVGAIRWGSDSSSIFIAIEVPPHGSCASMGTFRAFEIRLPEAQVVREYNQLEAKKLFWPSLGVELRNADDGCTREPGTCVPPGLQPPPVKQ